MSSNSGFWLFWVLYVSVVGLGGLAIDITLQPLMMENAPYHLFVNDKATTLVRLK